MPSTFRFLRQFVLPRADAVQLQDVTYRRGDESLPASLYLPTKRAAGLGGRFRSRRAPLPGWVALHGLTHRGRHHESLDGFARALAASGTAVLVPDLPEWRQLNVAPTPAAETIKAAVLALGARPETAPGRIGVIGFSFGGTRALAASTDPALDGHLAAVASWGAYADMERAVRFAFVGDHELDGNDYHVDPDPYGRWILAGNYLTLVPEFADAHAVQEAVHDLAREVGRRKILAWLPATDPLKRARRERLAAGDRELFDLLAPPAGTTPGPEARRRLTRMANAMARAAVAADPLLDPTDSLPDVPVPVFLAHGLEDRLVPWTELERLRRALPAGRVRHALVTRWFAHSFRERRFPTPAMVWEAARFARAIHRMVHLI